MEVLRVFNNNVVLARDELNREVVLTGRGIVFKKNSGDPIDPDRVARRFVPARNALSVGEVIADIPIERIALIEQVFARATRELGAPVPSSTIIAVVDHVNQAMERINQGLTMDYPLRAEVAHLHPEELRLAERMIDELNARQEVQLPKGEAIALALHLFDAVISSSSAEQSWAQSRLIAQTFDVLQGAYGADFDAGSIDAARFAAHLRYFIIRARGGKQVENKTTEAIAEALRQDRPRTYRVAQHVRELLELRLGIEVSEDEMAYLTMHLARLEAGVRRRATTL
ncbi:PRD domain-containing protein [Propionibacterium australiense]|uniref:PRD domain-containing protein n=1 Tax=Propionibacterium australiense TaxID=119981 RepID=A0A8B3FPT8_9ACTN|nr:PRD domain-containing protein [Propionibacterium australiense]RLP12831.1 PRD domain-containing protein [Propionibacterium australiense]